MFAALTLRGITDLLSKTAQRKQRSNKQPEKKTIILRLRPSESLLTEVTAGERLFQSSPEEIKEPIISQPLSEVSSSFLTDTDAEF